MTCKNAIIGIGSFLVLSCVGCHATADQNANSAQESGDELPADFVEFFDRFHADSAYQLAHIIFPLLGLPGNADTLVDPKSFRWQKENWRLHRPFDSGHGTFQRSFTLLDQNLVTEHITTASLNLAMERRFARLDEDWYLIYYAAMNPVGR